MTQRSHLFPFRTQKLSSVVPKILGWRRPGKIGRRRLFSLLFWSSTHRPYNFICTSSSVGAPEVSAASGGCSEPERAGQRRRAMRAHIMREVSATRRNRKSPWKCTTKRQDICPVFFVALPPCGGGFTVRAAALRFSSQGLSG